MGLDFSVMKPSDQLMWLWITGYVIMCWLVPSREDVYK